jgi:hypothetical protein
VSSGCAGLMRSRSAKTRGMAAASSQLPAGRSLTCSLINSWSQSTWRRRHPARTPMWTWGRWNRPTTRDCWSSGGGRQQEQPQQNEEEEEEQPFAMELVSACFLYITPLCSHAATRLCSLCLEVRVFRTESKRERVRFLRSSCFGP